MPSTRTGGESEVALVGEVTDASIALCRGEEELHHGRAEVVVDDEEDGGG